MGSRPLLYRMAEHGGMGITAQLRRKIPKTIPSPAQRPKYRQKNGPVCCVKNTEQNWAKED
jgi:hypothetical protein